MLFSFLFLFFYFLLFRYCSLQSDVGAEIGGGRRAVVLFFFFFLIYVFANVLISNMLHKVECVFQPDKLSLWRQNKESREMRVREGRNNEGGRVVGYLI